MRELNERIKTILIGILFALACIAFQQSSNVVALFIREPIKFAKSDANSWIGASRAIPAGDYYLSVGRPRGACDVYQNGSLVFSNRGKIPEVRNSLLLGGAIIVNSGSIETSLQIQCEQQKGFGTDFTHEPILSSFTGGVALQLWRAATELLIGPLFSLLLLATVVVQIRRKPKDRVNSNDGIATKNYSNSLPYLIFAAASLLYSLSLAYYTRLFLPGTAASILHIFLRNIFSLASILLFGSNSRHFRNLIAVQSILIISIIPISIIGIQPLITFYRIQYPFFSISTLLITIELFGKETRDESFLLLRSVSVTWSIIQIIDTSVLWTGYGAYTTPSLIALLTTVAAYQRVSEKVRTERIEIAASRILAVIHAKSPLREIIAQLASITSSQTHFSRVSAYIDGFCVGYADQPRKVFYRVMESGYNKDTTKDSRIEFETGGGTIMAEATQGDSLSLKRGQKDNAWFIVVPLGKHACLNLSDDEPSSPYSAYESEEILRRLHPALKTLDGRLIDHGLRHGFALEKLRSILGDGKWERTVGATFADINNYSMYTERYGQSFGDFVTAVFFPALIKAIGKWAAPEFIRGDEIYLVSVKELVPENIRVEESTFRTIQSIQEFLDNEGAQLCKANGFEPITMSIGASVGPVTLICDAIKVRTAGHIVNEAKRLQEAAGSGTILVKSGIFEIFPDSNCADQNAIPILVKKTFTMAKKIFLDKKAA